MLKDDYRFQMRTFPWDRIFNSMVLLVTKVNGNIEGLNLIVRITLKCKFRIEIFVS